MGGGNLLSVQTSTPLHFFAVLFSLQLVLCRLCVGKANASGSN